MGALKDPDSEWSAWDYVRDVCHQLRLIVDNTSQEDDDTTDRRLRRPFVIPLDGSGNGAVSMVLSPGNTMNLLTYGFQLNNTAAIATGYLAFYRDEEQGTGLILSTPLATIGTDNFNADGHFLPGQSTLLIVVRGGIANATLSGNVSAISTVTRARLATKGGGE